jgi:hypothetical protein
MPGGGGGEDFEVFAAGTDPVANRSTARVDDESHAVSASTKRAIPRVAMSPNLLLAPIRRRVCDSQKRSATEPIPARRTSPGSC